MTAHLVKMEKGSRRRERNQYLYEAADAPPQTPEFQVTWKKGGEDEENRGSLRLGSTRLRWLRQLFGSELPEKSLYPVGRIRVPRSVVAEANQRYHQ